MTNQNIYAILWQSANAKRPYHDNSIFNRGAGGRALTSIRDITERGDYYEYLWGIHGFIKQPCKAQPLVSLCIAYIKATNRSAPISLNSWAFIVNGEGGIWTLAPVSRPTPLAGAPLRPLEYFSNAQSIYSLWNIAYIFVCFVCSVLRCVDYNTKKYSGCQPLILIFFQFFSTCILRCSCNSRASSLKAKMLLLWSFSCCGKWNAL